MVLLFKNSIFKLLFFTLQELIKTKKEVWEPDSIPSYWNSLSTKETILI